MAISKLTVYNINHHSTIEQLLELINKQNEVIELANEMERTQLICEFDHETGDMKIIPKYLLNVDESAYDDSLWKEKY